jgi:hypothetical protein
MTCVNFLCFVDIGEIFYQRYLELGLWCLTPFSTTNINKTNKESLNSDGQQFHQNQQNKRKFKKCW